MTQPLTTSWSEINTFRQCPHKHKLSYIDKWRPPKLNKPLATGILWHEILENHYRGIQATGDSADPGKEALTAIIGLLNEHGAKNPDHPQHEVGAICLWQYHGYRRWAAPRDYPWTVREVEVEFEVPLPGVTTSLVGRIDLIVEYLGHLWIIDHKSVRNLPNQKELELDDQTPLYVWAVRQYGYPVRGAILSYSRTQQLKRPMGEDERFRRESIWRSDYELEVVVREAAQSIRMAYAPNQAHERHPDPQGCKWRCPYLDPCLGGRKAEHLEAEILRASQFTQKPRQLRLVTEDPGPPT